MLDADPPRYLPLMDARHIEDGPQDAVPGAPEEEPAGPRAVAKRAATLHGIEASLRADTRRRHEAARDEVPQVVIHVLGREREGPRDATKVRAR